MSVKLVTKSLDDRITDIMQAIVDADVGITDTSYGSVVRTLVSAIANEQDIMEYNIQYLYNCLDINNAIGDELDKLVEIFGVRRNNARPAYGLVKFYTSEPPIADIIIPYGTLVSTRRSIGGSIIEFSTTASTKIGVGETEVTVGVVATNPGSLHISENTVTVMNTPIMGVVGVTNPTIISGGSDMESDDEFRERAMNARNGLSSATVIALENALKNVQDVTDVSIVDMPDGKIGVVDIYVACVSMPPSEELKKEINEVVLNTKSAGIKANIIYPTIQRINVNINVTHSHYNKDILFKLIATNIIKSFSIIGPGDKFVLSKLIADIMNTSNTIIDVEMIEPKANISPTLNNLIRSGTITINSEVIDIG